MFVLKIAVLSVIFACTFGKQIDIRDDPTSSTPVPTLPAGDRMFSIDSSNAPDTQYEWDAVQCLAEAYILHPDTIDTVIQTFSELYQLKHTGTWNVNAGCDSLYIPRPGYIRIDLKVTEASGVTIINLYN
ncbi:hypothetical protein NQ314_003403 [Rhamnusium bicolor]|uniref:Lipoprotein n=1 Tax=Rhamnusium bicolor TaxID=1586634 RepID=A0AAV8ZM74_9CUCU|nr:hypothetical protein NQ314_003403 [Rhamnusium bicolor]